MIPLKMEDLTEVDVDRAEDARDTHRLATWLRRILQEDWQSKKATAKEVERVRAEEQDRRDDLRFTMESELDGAKQDRGRAEEALLAGLRDALEIRAMSVGPDQPDLHAEFATKAARYFAARHGKPPTWGLPASLVPAAQRLMDRIWDEERRKRQKS